MMIVAGESPPHSGHTFLWWLLFIGGFAVLGLAMQILNFFVLVGWVSP